jgi:FemAB-related protein (PEP-CTERM system-associated)
MAIKDNPQPKDKVTQQQINYELSALPALYNATAIPSGNHELNANSIVGILPLFRLKNILFGNSLTSLPFFDLGGILADDEETEKALLFEAIKFAKKLKVDDIELRQIEPLSWLAHSSKLRAPRWNKSNGIPQDKESSKYIAMSHELTAMSYAIKSHKVRMLLDLPDSSEMLMKSFKSKLRSQIKKPLKEGLRPKIGGLELLDDFYNVFSVNMRDLGSPVHSKKLIRNVLEEFPEKARIAVVYKDEQALACSLVVGFNDTLQNPWASALREYSRLSPNMSLYWTMLEYACDNGYSYFDFGRSSTEEGTYKFKEQWGAKPIPLHWHYILLRREPIDTEPHEMSRFDKAIEYWKKLPVPLTKIVGPTIRKHIRL